MLRAARLLLCQPNSFVYTMLGVFGSCLTIISIVVITSVIFFQGYKSPHVPPLCRVAVYFMGLSGMLQYLSIFNLFFSMQDLVLRATSQIDFAFDDPNDVPSPEPEP
jgi:hypothetical protein